MPSSGEIDEARRRVRMTVDARTTGRQASAAIVALVRERPELVDWDWVHDLTESSGDVETGDVDTVARAFARDTETPCWTVFVSRDPGLAIWCQVMDHQFPGRRHLVEPTTAAAEKRLDRLRSG